MRSTKLGVVAMAMLAAGTACGTETASSASRAASATSASAEPADPQRELRALEASHHDHIGAFALDTGTGRTVGYRMNERFPELSTWKAMEAAEVLDRARRSEPGLLDRMVHWTASQEVAGSPLTAGHGATGMTVSQLIGAAMSVSDNTAANLVLDQIGGDPTSLTRYYRSIHDPISRLDHNETALNDWRPGELHDTTTPASIGRDLNRVTLGDALTAPDRTRLIGWLRGCTTGGERIRAGLPKNWTVGDKTGTNSAFGAANDIAIAWPPSHAPLIITVYTYGKPGSAVDNKAISTAAAILARSLVPASA
ncbi:MAG: class A beta-lactamase [Actinoallomurus sp.]